MIDNEKLFKELEQERENGITRGEAYNTIVEENLMLVYKVINEKFNIPKGMMEDSVQEGSIGLMSAIDRYDYTKGYAFSTYAYHWIRMRVSKFLRNNTNIRIPDNRMNQYYAFRRTVNALRSELEREPTDEDILALTDYTESDLSLFTKIANTTNQMSIDTPLCDDTDTTIADTIEDQQTPSVNDIMEQDAIRDALESVMASLTDREEYVIRNYLGLGGIKPKSTDAIAKEMNISHQRVSQIYTKALRRLQRPHMKRKISEQLGGYHR